MVNLNAVKRLILAVAIFAGLGAIATEGQATDTRSSPDLAKPFLHRSGSANAQRLPVPDGILLPEGRLTPTPTQRLRQQMPLPKILTPNSQLTDTRIGAPMRSTDGISVSPTSDLQIPDWALSALQKLDTRYDCIEDNTDLVGKASPVENRELTRAKFAARLNVCLNRANESIASEPTDPATKEDLETIQRLQAEFATELTALRGRVEVIEAKTEKLKQQQFSATTKLSAQVWVNFTGAFPTNSITAERSLAQGGTSAFIAPTRVNGVPTRVQLRDTNPTVSNYLFLTLNSSFTGKDTLVTQLVAGNANSPANQLVSSGFFNTWGTPITDQTGTPQAGSNAVYIRELSYSFPLNDSVKISVGPRLNTYRYFDQNRFTNFLTGAGSFNSSGSTLFAAIDRGSGAIVSWNISPQFRFNAGYLGENTEFLSSANGFNTSSNPAAGLFGSTNQAIGELAYSPNKDLNIKLLYSRSLIRSYNGFIGGTVGEPLPYGYADDGFGGRLNDAPADTFVVNFDWLFTPQVGVFGRYSYGKTGIIPVNSARAGGNTTVQSIQLGLGFPDLGKKGALGTISYLIPHSYLGGREFLLSGGGDGGKQQELEFSYYYPASENIAIVPAFYAIFNPNNFQSNSPVYIGNVRMQFSF